MNDLRQHWNKAYDTKEATQMGWYEEKPLPYLQLIAESGISKNARIIDVGAGASTLIDELLSLNYKNVVANDLSDIALDKLKKRLADESESVKFVVDDLTCPKELTSIESVDLWHDRAVLHFFTEEADRRSYRNLLIKLLKPDGHVIIGTFSLEGAKKCNGLDVIRYSTDMLTEFMGDEFTLLRSFDHTFINPAGQERPFTYTLFKKLVR